jgi:hypothetical protein
MAYTPLQVPVFKGMRLDADPGDLGFNGAVDLKNVVVDSDGTIRTRPGTDRVDANTTAAPQWLSRFRGNSSYFLIGTGDLRAYNSSYASFDSDAGPTSAVHSIEYGVTAGARTYIVSASNVLSKYDGATWTSFGAATTTGAVLAVQPNDNRLVIGGASSITSRVLFSNVGDAETYATDNWVDLHPNDGQQIRMMVSWGNDLFVFKDTKFFIFYGNSVDGTGAPIFNYRAVDTGIGCRSFYAACAARDGVYFIHSDGVYRTTGGAPELVSAALQPYFDQGSNGFFTPSQAASGVTWRIHAGSDRLYVYQHGTTDLFVMDFQTREWTYWLMPVAILAFLPLDEPGMALFVNSTGQLYKIDVAFTDDDGTAIASHYQSGYATIADGRRARLRGARLEGSGTVNHALAVDLAAAGTTASVALTSGIGWDRRAVKGRHLGFKVSATSGVWSLSRWIGEVASVGGER